MAKINSTWMMSAFCFVLFLGFFTQANANELSDALDVMYTGEIDPSTARSVSNLTITHTDFSLHLESGTIAFFQPVTINGKARYWGAFFRGNGNFEFTSPIPIEQGQLRRFFSTDSLHGTCTEVAFLLSDSIYTLIQSNGTYREMPADDMAERAIGYLKDFTREEQRNYIFLTLKALMEPCKEPLLLAALRPSDLGYLWYFFNPFDREEIRLFKERKHFPHNIMETVCQYSQFAKASHEMINGVNKEDLQTQHVDIDGTITRDGNFKGIASISYLAHDSVYAFPAHLYPRITLDSITSPGGRVSFRRFTSMLNRQFELYVLPDNPIPAGDTATFTYYYSGKIAESVVDVFYVFAMYAWFPVYGWRQPATFSMHFHTPKGIEFVAVGNLKSSKVNGQVLNTDWEVTEPTSDVSFTIGFMKKHRFTDEKAGIVDVYYDEELSRLFADYYAGKIDQRPDTSEYGFVEEPDTSEAYIVKLGASMEKQVGDDLINATRLFTHRFGNRPVNTLSASEISSWHGQSFPGFLHLGAFTWMRTDRFGQQRMFRAHAVAHQWWGTGVGYETYHDQWLSEGFTEYSALMYVQSIEGNVLFLDKLGEYRKEIFNARKFLIGDAAEEGPIALGYRTQSSKAADDAYDLIIYKKGALVLHMLRNLFLDLNTMNEDAFFGMMKEWYTTYQGKNATTADFKRLTEKYVGVDMRWFFDQWVYGTELPTYTFSYEIQPDSNSTYKAICTVVSEGVSNAFVTDIPVQIQFDKDHSAYIRVAVSGPKTEFTIPGLTEKPKKVVFNIFESILAEVKQ